MCYVSRMKHENDYKWAIGVLAMAAGALGYDLVHRLNFEALRPYALHGVLGAYFVSSTWLMLSQNFSLVWWERNYGGLDTLTRQNSALRLELSSMSASAISMQDRLEKMRDENRAQARETQPGA